MAPNAIVTGAAGGIGRAIALRLARDGYRVCVNDVQAAQNYLQETVELIKSAGGTAIAVVADVSKREEVRAMVQTAVNELGPLWTMVANAGIVQVKPLLDLTEEDWQRLFAVNVFGVNNCYVEAAKQMIAQGQLPEDPPSSSNSASAENARPGVYKIIGASSIVAFKPFPLLNHYSAGKWAVRGMTQAMAMELAPYSITVNAYAPGIVATRMWEQIDEEMSRLQGAKKGATFEKFTSEYIALKRASQPEDVSNTVHFLASGDSDYMTGQNIVIDGGIVFT